MYLCIYQFNNVSQFYKLHILTTKLLINYYFLLNKINYFDFCFHMASCYIGELLYLEKLYGKLLNGEMLLRQVIWRNVIWRDVTNPYKLKTHLVIVSSICILNNPLNRQNRLQEEVKRPELQSLYFCIIIIKTLFFQRNKLFVLR